MLLWNIYGRQMIKVIHSEELLRRRLKALNYGSKSQHFACARAPPALQIQLKMCHVCKDKSTRGISLKLDRATQHLDHPSFPDRVKTERSPRAPRVTWTELC